ncbi:MAG: recombination protein RecR [Candidatus Buchananbacteria bacterium]|nr:recombination protein RecR [Candidatus Buchananbacteria bacterium]
MQNLPEPIKKLIDLFTQLPGIGPKGAERIVFSLLYKPDQQNSELANSISQIKTQINKCESCQSFDETNPCHICTDRSRDKTVLCLVGRPQDISIIEKTNDYQGRYFVLGGVIDPLEGLTADKLNLRLLVDKIKADGVKEVILALNPDMPGETTMLYLTKLLKQFKNLKITRLARGLPVGSDLEYADEVTLSNALKGRREI